MRGNTIGPDATGTASRPARRSASASTSTATASTIGGAAAGAGNVIAGHSTAIGTGAGIEVFSGRTATIQGNTIGLTAAGNAPLANDIGINLQRLRVNVQIGGTAPGAGNIVAGNSRSDGHGIGIQTDGVRHGDRGQHDRARRGR